MNRKLRFGIIGASRIAQDGHIPACKSSTEAELIALASRDANKASNWAQKYGIPKSYGSYQDLLNDDEIEAVIITLPNNLHVEWTINALKAGKHVICEKPFSRKSVEAIEAVSEAKKGNLILHEAYTLLFLPAVRHMQEVLAKGIIGDVKGATMDLHFVIKDWENDSRLKINLDMGVLMDAGCYCIHLLRHVIGRKINGVHLMKHHHPQNGVDCYAQGLVAFEGGIPASFIVSSITNLFSCRLEVHGTLGRIVLPDYFGGNKLTIENMDGAKTKSFASVNRFEEQIDSFSRAVRGEGTLPFTMDDIIDQAKAMELLTADNGAGDLP
jgi:D-xylose 1-dehydrogenase (NADP+, D-xylono-1,5-lactone-forming)